MTCQRDWRFVPRVQSESLSQGWAHKTPLAFGSLPGAKVKGADLLCPQAGPCSTLVLPVQMGSARCVPVTPVWPPPHNKLLAGVVDPGSPSVSILHAPIQLESSPQPNPTSRGVTGGS
ncbi:hypothetical protein GH733_006137 [Mirounga leonina]|nr:hypothetical protein GH733_006137 [Mirounga leonina]